MELEKTYIYQVYLQGSFSKAANQLFITQPALSIAIKKVEQKLGAPLFNRTQKPLTLTEIGKLYIEEIKNEMLLEQNLYSQVNDLLNLKAGTLTIGGSHYMNAYILPQYLAEYTKLYPEIKITLIERSSDKLVELLENHKLDITFSCDTDVIEQFSHYPAFEDTILLAVPKNICLPDEAASFSLTAEQVLQGYHLLEECPTVDLKSFASVNFILLNAPVNLGYRSLKMFAEAEIDPRTSIRVPQLVTAFHLAAQGIGATFISDKLIKRPEEELLFFKINSEYTKRCYAALLPKNQYTSKASKAFLKLLNYKGDNK